MLLVLWVALVAEDRLEYRSHISLALAVLS